MSLTLIGLTFAIIWFVMTADNFWLYLIGAILIGVVMGISSAIYMSSPKKRKRK